MNLHLDGTLARLSVQLNLLNQMVQNSSLRGLKVGKGSPRVTKGSQMSLQGSPKSSQGSPKSHQTVSGQSPKSPQGPLESPHKSPGVPTSPQGSPQVPTGPRRILEGFHKDPRISVSPGLLLYSDVSQWHNQSTSDLCFDAYGPSPCQNDPKLQRHSSAPTFCIRCVQIA